MNIILVIPTYNEADNIPILVAKVFKIFSDEKLDGNITCTAPLLSSPRGNVQGLMAVFP